MVLARDRGRCVECEERPPRGELDVHHLIPRAAGGQDEASNCVLLCDGCHAGRHPNLQVSLARRTIERWALKLAQWLDFRRELPAETRALQAGLELFGVDRFREGQLDVVLAALNGESLLVVRPTGSGKSLCFQLPAVLKGQPTTFVLSPTKALMVDQAMGLHEKKLPATFINGDVQGREKAARYELLERDALAMIYLTPERFGRKVRSEEVARLTRQRPSFLVVDEAHCVDAWGQDFRPDYGRLAELRQRLGEPPVLALTATAGLESQQRILRSLGIEDAHVLLSDVDRPNIALTRLFVPSDAERAQIVARLLQQLEGRALIFVPTERAGHEVRAAMAAAGRDLEFYNGKLPKLDRDSLQQRFSGQHEPAIDTLITTTAFGMGVDIPDIRLVVHWLHSHTVEDYAQEFGRAGRDGRPALALLFTKGPSDLGLLEWMARSSSDESVKQRAVSSTAAARHLQRRLERLDLLQSLTAGRDRCFRTGLLEVLQGPRRRVRRSLARRLLDLVLARRTKTTPAGVCCDFCNRELLETVRSGALVLDGRPLGGRLQPRLSTPRAPRPKRAGSWLARARLRLRQLGNGIAMAIGAAVALAAIYIGVGFVILFIDVLSPNPPTMEERAADVFETYISHRTNHPFTSVEVRRRGGTYIACARPEGNPRTLCLLTHPKRPEGKRVSGWYVRYMDGRVECVGAARRLPMCRSD